MVEHDRADLIRWNRVSDRVIASIKTCPPTVAHVLLRVVPRITRRILSVRGRLSRFQTKLPLRQQTGSGILELFSVCITWFIGEF